MILDWISLYQQGFIPGPHEEAASFYQRVLVAQDPITQELPSLGGKAEEILLPLYGFIPKNIEVRFSSKELSIWEAGCAYPLECGRWVIQLKKKPSIVPQEELLAHELVHIARAHFEEPRFEEILAYQTSSHKWRRSLGALFRYRWESSGLMLLTALDLITLLIFDVYPFTTLTAFMALFFRLQWTLRQFKNCIQNLSDPHLIVALTDKEIAAIAKGSRLEDLDDGSIRFAMIKALKTHHSTKLHRQNDERKCHDTQ